MHWVSKEHAGDVEVRLYDNLFKTPNPMKFKKGGSMLDNLNPDSLMTLRAKVEPSLMTAESGFTCQFERTGYFTVDSVDSAAGALVFNRAVSLRDSWAKVEKVAANQAAQRAQKAK
jgi:glutaminyl-tRNA synthetase